MSRNNKRALIAIVLIIVLALLSAVALFVSSLYHPETKELNAEFDRIGYKSLGKVEETKFYPVWRNLGSFDTYAPASSVFWQDDVKEKIKHRMESTGYECSNFEQESSNAGNPNWESDCTATATDDTHGSYHAIIYYDAPRYQTSLTLDLG
jgi:hypothetical protein